jgi:perosamine synthetase
MSAALPAVEGGTPVRDGLLPYGGQVIEDDDVEAVGAALRSGWLTTGPLVPAFEAACAQFVGTAEAVAVNSGTAALHAAAAALRIGPGDEVIVPAMTFAATSNAVVYQGGTPVFVDVDPATLLIDVDAAARAVTKRTRAIFAVDYAGQSCDYDALRALCAAHGLALVADACHALGGSYHGRPVGSLADLSTFSFHPVKPITTAEGGVVTTEDPDLAARMRVFRNHGLNSDHRQRDEAGSWFYEMVELGFNYRLNDIQCALGLNQLRKLPPWLVRRRAIAAQYDAAFEDVAAVQPLARVPDTVHGFHIYVVLFDLDRLRVDRAAIFRALRAEGIGVNVHYVPVHLHPYYRERFGTGPGLCPVAEDAYGRMLTLPVTPRMDDSDVADVVDAVRKVVEFYAA